MQTVLYVEDDKEINQEVSIGLKAGLGSSVQILSVYTIEEARKMIQEIRIDLFILDIDLPDGSGIDLAREIRKKDEGVPIMVASSYATEQLHTKLNNELDVFLVLKKPYRAENMLRKIRVNLRKVEARQEEYIKLRDGRIRFKLPISEIVKVETVKGQKRIEVTFYNKEEGVVSSKEFPMQSMEEFMNLIKGTQGLMRIHQSTVVNPDFVLHYDGAVNELHLKHVKQVLSIGKTYRETEGLLFDRMK